MPHRQTDLPRVVGIMLLYETYASLIEPAFGVNEMLQQLDRITRDPHVMGGKPCIRGMRVTVGTILGLLAAGHSQERVLQAYPYLEPEDIQQALSYAMWRVEEVEILLGQHSA